MHQQILRTAVRSISTKTQTTLNIANVAVANDRLDTVEQKAKEDANSRPDNWDSAKPYSEIPGPKPLPVIGNVWRFFPIVGDLHGLNTLELLKKIQDYGDVAILRNILNRPDIVVVRKPEYIEHVFRNEGIWPHRMTFATLEYYRDHVRNELFKDAPAQLATANGKEWQISRSISNPILSQIRSVEMYVPETDRVTADFMERVRFLKAQSKDAEMPENFLEEISKWALESVAFVALDKRLGCLENELQPDSDALKAINAVHDFFEYFYKLEVRPSLWKYIPTRNWRKFVEAMDTMTFIFRKYVLEAKKEIDNNPNKFNDSNNKSMLQRFLDINENYGIIMATDMLTAGVDTTSNAAAAILYLLAQNKGPQEELRKELKQLLPRKDSPITKEILGKAQYLKATVKEGQRLAGVTGINMRTMTKDIVLGGYQIPKGTQVQLLNFLSQLSEEQFPQTTNFIPERWLRSNTGELSHKNAHPFTYMPFGFGPRTCIGMRLALMEMEVLLAKFVRNFEIEWPHPPARFTSKALHTIASPLKFRLKEVQD